VPLITQYVVPKNVTQAVLLLLLEDTVPVQVVVPLVLVQLPLDDESADAPNAMVDKVSAKAKAFSFELTMEIIS
jgi:hypothetical protein